jgi:GntR family phosphonate transport system transcriptional regulator
MKNPDRAMERRSGISLWRQIADQIRRDLVQGKLGANGRLPPETALAAHFGVNRHTVRGAIAALVEEGVLRAEQGRGTFVEQRRRLTYPIGVRTRFSEGLRDQARDRRGHLLDHREEAADQRTAEALGLAPAAPVIRMDTVSEADGRPVSRATSWFDADRFGGFAETYRELGSVTLAFQRYGVADYFRSSTLVSARRRRRPRRSAPVAGRDRSGRDRRQCRHRGPADPVRRDAFRRRQGGTVGDGLRGRPICRQCLPMPGRVATRLPRAARPKRQVPPPAKSRQSAGSRPRRRWPRWQAAPTRSGRSSIPAPSSRRKRR